MDDVPLQTQRAHGNRHILSSNNRTNQVTKTRNTNHTRSLHSMIVNIRNLYLSNHTQQLFRSHNRNNLSLKTYLRHTRRHRQTSHLGHGIQHSIENGTRGTRSLSIGHLTNDLHNLRFNHPRFRRPSLRPITLSQTQRLLKLLTRLITSHHPSRINPIQRRSLLGRRISPTGVSVTGISNSLLNFKGPIPR